MGELGPGIGLPEVPEGTPKVLDPPVPVAPLLPLPMVPELPELSGMVAPEEPGRLDDPDAPP